VCSRRPPQLLRAPTSETFSKDDFVVLNERCMHSGLKARVALLCAAGSHEVSLTCYLPTSSSTPVPAAKRHHRRRRCCDPAAIAVSSTSRSVSVNMLPPATRATAADNVIFEPCLALPLTLLPLPAPTPGLLVNTPQADMTDMSNSVYTPAKQTRKAKRRCEVELLRCEDQDGELHLSPISCEPCSLPHVPPTLPLPLIIV
jgi:hypothetical protein